MNIIGVCSSEFNQSADNFLKLNVKKIFITTSAEEIKKIEKHWGSNKPPIVCGRVMVNTKKFVELDKLTDFHLKIVKYMSKDNNGKKFTNHKFVLVSSHSQT